MHRNRTHNRRVDSYIISIDDVRQLWQNKALFSMTTRSKSPQRAIMNGISRISYLSRLYYVISLKSTPIIIFQDNQVQEPETLAIMNWTQSIPFVLSANLHGGSLVANYPYDGNQDMKDGKENLTPDNSVFVHLAHVYSDVSFVCAFFCVKFCGLG